MCTDYMIYDSALWSNTLRALAELAMWSELARALVALSGVPDLWLLSCVPDLWKQTLDAHVSQLEGSDQPEDLQAFVELLLQSPYLVDEYYQTMASRALQRGGVLCVAGASIMEQMRTFLSA